MRIADDEVPGLVVHPASVHMVEGGGPQTYQVKLGSRPADTVTVRVTSTDEKAVMVEEEVARGMLIFSPEQWSQARTVRLQAVNDEDTNNELVAIANVASSLDPAYQNRSQTVLAYVLEGEPPALALHVAAITDDDTINLAEKAEGFTISGDTGAVDGAAVSVSVGSGTPLTTASAKAQGAQGQNGLALWSVSVPAKAPYITGTSVAVVVTAAGTVHKAAVPVSRTLGVDLAAPAVRYTALTSLQVGEAIARMSPETSDKDIASYSAVSLPAGLSIDGATGAISGAPAAAGASAVTATVTVTDQAGNRAAVSIIFPAVVKGEQSLDDFTVPPDFTVQPESMLLLRVDRITGDDTINSVEKGAGFVIEGNTGSVAGVAVKVTIGTQNPLTLTAESVNAQGQNDPAAWSVNVPPDSSHFTDGTDMTVKVEATKLGYTAAVPVSRTLRVDLAAPAVTFSPADRAVVTNPASNVTVKFDEAVRKANGEVFDASAAAAAVTLKKAGSDTDLATVATVSLSGRVITIDPANSLTAGEYTVTLLKGHVEDLRGNKIGTVQTATFTVNAGAPSVTFSPASGDTAGPDVIVTAKFGEAVRNIDKSAITNTNAHAVVELKKGDLGSDLAVSNRVKVNVGKTVISIDPANPLTTGSYTVRVLANVVEGSHNNRLGTAPAATFTVDADPPAVTFAPADGRTAGPDVTVTVSFDEAVRNRNGSPITDLNVHAVVELKKGDSGSDLAVSNRVKVNKDKTAISIDPASPLITGSYTVRVLANAVEDRHGNLIKTEQTADFTVDAVAPTLEITLVPAAFNGSGDAIEATFTFSKVVTGFELTDVKVDGGTPPPAGLTESAVVDKEGKVWTGTFTTTGDSGDLVVTVQANAAQDSAGNWSPVSLVRKTAVRDTTAPEVTITEVPGYTSRTAFLAKFTFTEAVNGFAVEDVTVSNGVLGNLTAVAAVAAGTAWSAQVTPNGGGDVEVKVRANAVTDVAGNTGPRAAESETAIYDAVAPKLMIALVPAAFNAASDKIAATFTFSEVVTGFDPAADITVSGGDKPNALVSQKSGKVYTGTFTTGSSGDLVVTVPANTAQDRAGNTGPANSVSKTATRDTAPPVVTFAPAHDAVMTNPASNVTVSFGEAVRKAGGGAFDNAAAVAAVTLVKVGDISNPDLAVSNRVTINAEKQVITINPANSLESGSRYTVTLRKNHVEDLLGNQITVDQTATFTVDADPPVVTFSPADGDPAGPDVTVTVSFDEAVRNRNGSPITDLNAHAVVELKKGDSGSDLAVVNRVKVNRDKTAISIDPLNPLTTGSYTVRVLANAVADRHGNLIGTEQTADFTVDAVAPTLGITLVPAAFNGSGDAIGATFTFSKVVTGFELADITVDGGTPPAGLTESAVADKKGKVWTGTFTTTGDSGDLVVTVSANAAQDSAGNWSPVSSVGKTAVRDTTAPEVTITEVPGYTSRTAFLAKFTFTEAVNGFAVEDVTVSNGVLGNLTAVAAVAAGTAWSAQVTPNGGGDVEVKVRANAVTDVAGNTGPRAAESETAIYDAVAPTLMIALIPAAFNAASDKIAATFTFSEVVTGFDPAADITVSGGDKPASLTGSKVAGKVGKVYTGTFTTGSSGDLVVTVPANAAQDRAGNTGPANQISKTATRDTAPPVVTFAPVNSAVMTDPASNVTVSFDEAVRKAGGGAFDNAAAVVAVTLVKVGDTNNTDLAVTGQVTISGRVITIDPANSLASGSRYTVTLLKNHVEDLLGNPITVDQTATFTVDADPPAVTFSPAGGDTAGPNVIVTVTFDEAVREPGDGPITNSNAHAVVELKKDNTGSDLAVTGRVTILGRVITIDPASPLITGSYTVRVLANTVEDSHDNELVTAQEASFAVDADAPTLGITLAPAAFNAGGARIVATFEFSEVVTDFESAADIRVSGGTKLGSLTESAVVGKEGKVYTGTFTTSGTSGDLEVTVLANAAQDSVGNRGPANPVSKTAVRDTAAPGVGISGVPAYLASTTAFTAAFTFTEAVSGFAAEDVTVSNGGLGNLEEKTAGTVWSAPVTPDGKGNVEVKVLANRVTDVAGNTGPAVAVARTAIHDAVAPTLGITLAPAAFNAVGATIEATFEFSEVVTDFESADITVSGGNKPNTLAASHSGKVYTGTFTTAGTSGDLVVTVRVNAARDRAGNPGPANQVSKTATRDTAPPVVTFAPLNSAVMTDPASDVTVTFDEAVRKADGDTFDDAAAVAAVTLVKVGDNTDTDLAVSNRVMIDAEKQVITINPANALVSGSRYTVTLRKNHVEDLLGNRITVDQTATFTVDADPPGVTFAPLDNAVVMDLTINVTVTFDEAVRKAPDGDVFDDAAAVAAVTLVEVGDISNPGLAVSNRVTIDAEKQVITIDPANLLESGSRYTVTLRKNHVEDLPGNEITVDQTATFTVDADPPAVRYTPPPSLQVGVAITSMRPQTVDKDKNSHSYSATSLPDGLSIADASTGEITGTPTTAGAAVTAAVTVTDAAGNSSPVSIKFPKVDKGEQTLSGFSYSASSLKLGATAPMVRPPAGAAARVPLVYATTPASASVCSVNSGTGKLTILKVGQCVITATAAGNVNYDGGTISFTVTVQPVDNKIDYDADNDGLIEITKLEQLNAMRWDTDGNAAADVSSNDAAYAAAFPHPVAAAGGGNGALGCSDDSGAAAACTGYELKANLDFNEDASYANAPANKLGWTSGLGWEPVGTSSGGADWLSKRFRASFDGNGHAVANLFINRPSANNVGLFGMTQVTHKSGARIRNVGLTDVNVTGQDEVGALAGRNFGTLRHCYASGRVVGRNDVGGLVGINGWDNKHGSMYGSFAEVAVSGGAGQRIGGLVGRHYGAIVSASYAASAVSGSGSERGALIGSNEGSGSRIEAVYATGRVAGSSSGGLTGNIGGPAASASYWDTLTSGQDSSGRGVGKTTAELQTPIDYAGIYAGWNLDLDSDSTVDDPWDFGDTLQYPALKADLNGDGVATVAEFGGGLGHQAPRVGLVVSETAVTVGEDGGEETYKVALRAEPAAEVEVALASGDDSAAAVLPPLLTFTTTDWSTEQPVTVTGVNDNIDNTGDVRKTEIRYTVSSTDSDYDNIIVPPLAVVVADDDTAALVLSVSPTTLVEGDGGAVAVDVTVRARLSGAAIHGDLVLPLTLDGTAQAGVDYELDALPVITIAGGNTTATATLSITPLDDAIDEGDEMIAIGVAHARFGVAAPAQVTLTDNDTAAGLVLSVSPARLDEDAGATNVTVTATLSSANSSGSEVVLPLNFSGSAAKGVDYTLSGTGSITISVGVSSGDTTLAITPTDDAIDEGLGEIVEIGTTYNGNKVAATLLLTDDDAGAPALSIEMAAWYVGADPIAVRFVFPEPVTDFAPDGVTVSGGTLGALSTQDGGRTYVSAVTPDAPIPDSITVTVKQDAVTDRSGNTGPAAPVAKTAQYDVTAPTLEIKGLPSALHGAEPLVLVFRFSEPVEFGRSDVEVTNGRVTDFSGDGAVYKVEVTPDGGAVLRVGVKLGAVADGAGNTVAPISETAAPVDGELTLSKRIVRTPGRYLQSLPDQVLSGGMVVQGAEVHYQASLPQNSPLDLNSVEYSYAFVRKQGDVEFLAQDDDGNTATNRFRADWYGENIVEVTATDAAGKKAAVSDKVFVHFASRRILGGAAENLTQDQKDNIFRPDIHDRREASPGMAFVPGDIARADPASQKVAKGFHKVTEEKLLKTSRGTLLVASHISTIYPKLPRGDMVPGQGIALSRSGDFGNTWRNMLLVQQDDHLWGFPAFVEVGNAVYLYVLAGHPETVNYFPSQGWGGPYNTKYRGIYYFKSTDDGLTWSQPTRHDGLSTTVGIPWKESYSSADTFPKGAQPSTNILKVPNLQLDGKVSPLGYGLLLHAYGTGSMLASLDDGATWSKVANHNGHVNVAMHTEPAWTVLDNDDGDIYMIFRDDFGRFKQEYVMSREMQTGSSGLTFKAKHRQSLGNARGRAAHHWLTTIRSGEQRGRLLYSTPGAYTRHHVDLLVSRQAIQGQATIGSNLFGTARVKEGVGWGYSAVEYLEADLENTRGMGKDAVVLVGESEPIHKQTHQIIDLKPDRRGHDERFAATAYLVSWEYVEHLLREWEERTARALSFEPEEDWPTGTRGQYRAFSDFTDKHGHRWQGNAHVFRGIKDIWISNTAEHADRIEARNGFQVMALGYSTAQPSSVVLNPAGAGGVAAVSFYVKRFAHNLDAIKLVVEHNAGSGWQVALDRTYSGVAIPSSYTWVHVPINQPGDVQLRFRVEGTYGLLIDDITLTAAPGR